MVATTLLSVLCLGAPVSAQTSSPAQPPAMPLSATERVLELTLEDAIRLGLQHNLDIERERYSPLIQFTDVEKGRAAFDPVVGVDATISQNKILPVSQTQGALAGAFSKNGEVTPNLRQRFVTGTGYEIRFVNRRTNVAPGANRIVDPRYDSSLELSFTQPLLRDFGISVNTAGIRQAEKATEIAEQQVVQAILDTVFAVQRGYWDLVFRIQDLGAKRASQKLAEDFLEENKIRVELGTLAPIELVQAETRVKTREGEVIVAESAVGDAEDQLKQVLNLPETMGTWLLRVRPTDSPPFAPATTPSVQEKVIEALNQRPDFVQSQLRIDSLEIRREAARNQQLPRLDFQARGRVEAFSGDYPESAENLGEGEGYFWSVGLKFEYPLGNRFARNEVQRRNLELKQALVDQRQLKRTIVRQIRQAIRDLETTVKRVEVTRAATVLAQTQLEAEQEKFRLGLSTSFVVLDFQEDLTIARSDETRAVSDYNVALARLDQLTGTLRYGEVTGTK
jgi:outer membrane protein TolC